ncbi:MAG: hypothetical protein V4667_13220 [Bacteroidota bacterium]
MNKRILGAICLIASFFNTALAQGLQLDTILLLNSQKVYGKVIDTTKNLVKYQYIGKKGKQFESGIETERVFSIKYADGKESLLYSPDSTNDEEFSVEDMRYFIKGQQDAYEHYKTKKSFYTGIGMGLVGTYVVTPMVILSPVVPGIYSFVNGSRWMKIKKMKGATAEDLTKDTYLMGYTKVVRNKRIQSSLKGSAIGLAVGITTMYIFRDQRIGLFD